MKLLILAAVIVTASSGQINKEKHVDYQAQQPWQVGKLYRYNIESHTLAQQHEAATSGSAFKATFVIRVKAQGKLQAKLENPQHVLIHQQLLGHLVPKDLKYQPVKNLDKPFEIAVEGGRVLGLNIPPSLSQSHENLLKGLVGALQLDLSTYRIVHSPQDNFDKESWQGQFRKMETDVTGDCETLYTVLPVTSEWRRELHNFTNQEEPMEITKSKNYGKCHHRVAYHFGVPQGAEWTGTAHKLNEEQFMSRAYVARFLVGRKGPIYKSEITNAIHVHPHLYGKQKAEVHSYIRIILDSYEDDKESEWQMPEGSRIIKSLLYSMTTKQIAYHDKSSSSSESNENSFVDIEVHKRFSRSLKQNKAVKKVINKKNADDSSSSSSDSLSAFVNDDLPNPNEPAYSALYMSSQPQIDVKQIKLNVQKLLKDMSQLLQNPSGLPKGDFLSKFNILVRLVAAMTTEQLSQTSRSMEVSRTSKNIAEANVWMIYRDAIVQAGTLPTFQQVMSWIETKVLEGEEAAQVLATLIMAHRYPTKDAMMQLFNLALSSEVSSQRFLNTTALLSACKFINMGQINNETAHYYYPTHMYGRLARKHDSFVTEDILPRLSQLLKLAVENNDSSKAQVYIKALGTLGHREILNIFTPYLEGKISVTTYLRVQMITNLKTLAYQKDRHVRAVLFSILKNTAEPYEVRVAAILNIFMAQPTAAMMQVMARLTHDDPSYQVRGVLKSGIESAADLKSPRYFDLSRTARAVKWLLPHRNYGYSYSFKFLHDAYESDYELDIFKTLGYIGSEDSILPKHLRYSLRSKSSGWNKENSIETSFSSIQRLIHYFYRHMSPQHQQSEPQSKHKYPSEKISKMLNIKYDPKDPLEASIFIDLINQQRFYTFSEDDLNRLFVDVKEYFKQVENGVEKHYTKVLNQDQVSIMFPLAMGMPFIYKYKVPTLVHIYSTAKGQIKFPSKDSKYVYGNMDKEVQFTFARNIDGNVGFMDTLFNQLASVGIVNKLQVHLPFKMNLELKSGELIIKMEPLHPDQDSILFHYSVWPYSASQKKDTLVTISQDPNTKLIEHTKKVLTLDHKFGHTSGAFMQIQGYSYSTDFLNLGSLFRSRDLLSNFAALLYQRDVGLTNINLKHLVKQSPNKVLMLTLLYDKFYNQKHNGEFGPAENYNDVTPSSEERRKEMVKRVAFGINNAKVEIVDLSATFDGNQKIEFVFTGALGRSPLDIKTQYALFASRNSAKLGNSQVNFVGNIKRPLNSPVDVFKTLNKELKLNFEHDIKFGQGNGNIHIKGYAERSKEQTEELKKHPLAKLCAEDISSNQHLQHDCNKWIIMSYAPNHFKASVTYKDVTPMYRDWAYQVYRLAEHYVFWYTEVNPLKTTPEGKLEIEMETSYTENTLDVMLNSRYGEVRMKGLPLPKISRNLLAIYPVIKPSERVKNYLTHDLYLPYCTIDSKRISTFSKRVYDYSISKSWHVVMQGEGLKLRNSKEQIVALARKPSEKLEFYLSYHSETGKSFEIELQPAPEGSNKPHLKINTNSKKVCEGDLTTYWDDLEESPLVEYYMEPEGVMTLNVREDRFRVMYDGLRLFLFSSFFRNMTSGICGYMSSERRSDYLTPLGLIDHPDYFAASYALHDANSDPHTLELSKQAKEHAYQPKHKNTMLLHSDSEWVKAMESSYEDWGSENVYRSRSYLKKRGVCKLQHQVQYYENHGEICITTTPVEACPSYCSSVGYRIQAAQVTCRPKTDQEFAHFRDQIHQGLNPSVAGVPHIKHFRVPTSCKS